MTSTPITVQIAKYDLVDNLLKEVELLSERIRELEEHKWSVNREWELDMMNTSTPELQQIYQSFKKRGTFLKHWREEFNFIESELNKRNPLLKEEHELIGG